MNQELFNVLFVVALIVLGVRGAIRRRNRRRLMSPEVLALDNIREELAASRRLRRNRPY